ncbi:hypothetical protein M405DRAFT_815761 [Rhizopogon salebrosus TDB-379]|nr:hypothetical protein M405DRAFT_815761 [Rhizopogon salebrosus TDB-379]
MSECAEGSTCAGLFFSVVSSNPVLAPVTFTESGATMSSHLNLRLDQFLDVTLTCDGKWPEEKEEASQVRDK